MPLRELISGKHQQITGIARHQNVIKDIPFRILRGWVFRSQLLTVHIIRARWKQCSASSQSFMNLGDIINHSAMAGALDKGRAIAEVRAIYHFNYVTLSNIFPLIIRHHRRLARLSLHSDTNAELCTRIHLNQSPIIGIHFFLSFSPIFSYLFSPHLPYFYSPFKSLKKYYMPSISIFTSCFYAEWLSLFWALVSGRESEPTGARRSLAPQPSKSRKERITLTFITVALHKEAKGEWWPWSEIHVAENEADSINYY